MVELVKRLLDSQRAHFYFRSMLSEEEIWAKVGKEGFTRIAAEFYLRMKKDDLIGPMYPQDDWDGSEERFRDFLHMRFGAESRYLETRGHPRLRMRHMPFRVGIPERVRWLDIMHQSMKAADIPADCAESLSAFFAQVADFMRNQPE